MILTKENLEQEKLMLGLYLMKNKDINEDRAFKLISHYEEFLPEKSPIKFRDDIAIISNGAFLKNYGSFIDKHSYVARFNNFKIKDYEDKVGTKTDIHVINCKMTEPDKNYKGKRALNTFVHPFSSNAKNIILIDSSSPHKTYRYYGKEIKRFLKKRDGHNLFVIKPSFYFDKPGRTIDSINKTTGFMFVELAKETFTNDVNLFGFTGNSHYFNSKWSMYEQHDVASEHKKCHGWKSELFHIFP